MMARPVTLPMKKARPAKPTPRQAAKPALSGLFCYGRRGPASLYAVLLWGGLSLICLSVSAERKPKFEIGILGAAQALNDYRGSKEIDQDGIVLPVLIYRGDRIRIDRNGVRGELLKTPRFELNVSGEASLGGAENSALRDGMPELGRAIEFGPSLNINLSGDSFDEGWSLRLPVRSVATFDSKGLDYIGYLANPRLTYRIPDLAGWRSSLNLGAVFGSNRYHDFYYRVAPEYETPERPRYEAESGFSGWYSKMSFSRRKGQMLYGFNLRYDNLTGASFLESPLVETKHYFSVGVGVIWFFWQSER